MTIYKEYRTEIREILSKKSYILMSDDLDSYLATTLVKNEMPQMTVEGFFNPYEIMTYTNTLRDNQEEVIGLDLTLFDSTIDTISNHVESVLAANYSNGISCNAHIYGNYTDKCVFSTTLMIWSSLGRPLPQTELGKMLLLSIDGTYIGYYKFGGKYRQQLLGYLRAYELEELIEVLDNHTLKEFEEVYEKYISYFKSVEVKDGIVLLEEFGTRERKKEILAQLELEEVLTNKSMDFMRPCCTAFLSQEEFIKVVHSHSIPIVNYARVYSNKVTCSYLAQI